MKQLLEVTVAFEVQVELAEEVDAAEAPVDLRARLETESLKLTYLEVQCPTEILSQTEAICNLFKPQPDEFRCDSCRREFSNDEKYINGDGDELCNKCRRD